MMRLPPFRYVAPATSRQAASLLREHGPEAMPVAGGTDLYPNMKRRQFEPKVLVGLRGIESMRRLHGDASSGLDLGASLTLSSLAANEQILLQYPALASACEAVSSPLLRNMGTIGGNLCIDTRCNYYNQNFEWRQAIHFCLKKDGDTCWVAPGGSRCWAISSSDTAPVFIALQAELSLVGPEGDRRIPVEALYRPDGIDWLGKRADELVESIHLPPSEGIRATYLKLRRRDSIDFPILGVAAALRFHRDGTVEHARIVLTAVESAPVVATKAQEYLIGKKLTDQTVDEASAIAYRPARPLDNTDLTHFYRKKMAKVFVARALRELRP